jgi:hypothetical protein
VSYAVIDESVLRRTHPHCYQLYGFLDQRQIDKKSTGLTAHGVAKAIGWKRETVYRHLRHLVELGFVEPLEDGKIAVRTNAVRHRVPVERNVPEMDVKRPADGRSGWWMARKEGAGQAMPNVPQADVPKPLITNLRSSSGNSRDALLEQPRSEGRHHERVARVTVADCRCGRLLLTATDHRAGMCVFCRDADLEAARWLETADVVN